MIAANVRNVGDVLTKPLNLNDLIELEKSGISERLAVNAGIFRVDSPEGARLVGQSTRDGKDFSGVVFPYFYPGEQMPREFRVRLDHPDYEFKDGVNKPKNKYYGSRERRGHIYIPPGTPEHFLNDSQIPCVIVEGEKKALAMCGVFHEPTLVIGLPGVWNWRCRTGFKQGPDGEKIEIKGFRPRLEKINWNDRDSTIIFDADISKNESVYAARKGLTVELANRGAGVSTLDIPYSPGGQGPDDLIYHSGVESFKEFFIKNRCRFNPIDRAKIIHQELNQLPPASITVNQKYLNVEIPPTGIVCIKSPMGSGKTETLKWIVSKNSLDGKRTFLLGHRNSLLKQTCTRTGLIHIHDLQNKKQVDRTENIALCVDSLKRISIPDGHYDIILDETESVIQHLLTGETCKTHRGVILIHFEKLLAGADRVLLMDAGLTGISLSYIQNLCPEKLIHLVINNAPMPKWNVLFDSGTATPKGVKSNDRSGILDAIIDSLANGQRPLVMSDSQDFIESLERVIKNEFPESVGLRVDRTTTASDHPNNENVQLFLSNPNVWIDLARPDYLLCSPTVESGVSITENHFGKVFGVFTGVVQPGTILQMLGRYRVPVARHIWVKVTGKTDSNNPSPFPDEIHRKLFRFHSDVITPIALSRFVDDSDGDDDDDSSLLNSVLRIRNGEHWNDPHLETMCNLIARDNFEMSDLRDNVRAALVDAGHNVRDVTTKQDEYTQLLKTKLKAEKKNIQSERAQDIALARDITPTEADEIQSQPTRSNQEQCELDKYFLTKAIPGVDVSPDLVKAVLFEHQGIIQSLKLFVLTSHPDIAKSMDAAVYRQQKNIEQSVVLNDLVSDLVSVRVDLLNELGIPQMCRADKLEFTEASDVVQRLVTLVKQPSISQKIKLHLGLTASGYQPIKLIGQLVGKLGFRLQSRQTREGDVKIRRYTIHPILDDNFRTHDQILKSLESKILSHVTCHTSPVTRDSEYIYIGTTCGPTDQCHSTPIDDIAKVLNKQFKINHFQAHEQVLGLPEYWVKTRALKWCIPGYAGQCADVDQLKRRADVTGLNDSQVTFDILEYLNSIKLWVDDQDSDHQPIAVRA